MFSGTRFRFCLDSPAGYYSDYKPTLRRQQALGNPGKCRIDDVVKNWHESNGSYDVRSRHSLSTQLTDRKGSIASTQAVGLAKGMIP